MGVTLSNTKNVKSAFVAEFYTDSNMSELQLRLADVTVRAKITSDAQHVSRCMTLWTWRVQINVNRGEDKNGRI